MPAPVFKIGSANSTGSGSSLAIPVTTPTAPGNPIVVFAKQNGATVTSVTDSTGGNVYTVQQTNAGNTFDVITVTVAGATQVGAAYSTASYSGSGSALVAAQELDTWLNGGGANWPTHKLSPRTMAFNVFREYYNTDTLISGSGTGWPTSAGADTKNLAGKASNGVQNVCITFRPQRDGTNAYTGAAFTTEFNNLVNAIAYVKSVFPKAKFCLWHEANIFGVHGPFGNASSDPGLGSPYGPTVTTAQMHANWAAYVGKYGPAFQAAGADLYWVNSMASPSEAIDFFDIALNNTQRGYFTGIASDCYTGNFIDGSGNIKTSLTTQYGTNNYSILGLAAHYGLPSSIWELGAGNSQAATHNVTFLDQAITQPLVAWQAAGNPVAEVLYFNYGGDVIGSAMDPSVLAAMQRMYDALQGAGQGGTTALPIGSTITVNWTSGANTKFAVAAGISLPSTGQPDQKVTAAGTSAAPSATTGTLAQSNEIALAYCSDSNASGNITWAGGWTTLATDQTGSSTFQSLAYQQLASTSAVTASGTITSGAWDVNLITFPVSPAAVPPNGLTVPKPSIAGTGNVATPGGGTTGVGAMTVPKPRMSATGIGNPGVPYVIGSVQGSGTSLSIPVTANVNNGDSIQVGVVLSTTTSTPTIGPDTAGNTYSFALAQAGHNDSTFVVYQCDGANPLTQGVDSIPISQTTSGALGGLAIGDNAVFGADAAAGLTGASTSPSTNPTPTLSQAEEHVFGWLANGQAGGTPAWGSGLTALGSVDVNSTTFLSVAYKPVSSTSPVSASATIVSADWGCGVLTNKVTPTSITLIPSNGVIGVPYSQTPEFAGGLPPTAFSISGSLPPGLTLASGVISGVPTAAGSYTFTLIATDSLSITTSVIVTIEILSVNTGTAPMTQLSNNLFSAADSDFETQGWSWGGLSNAAAPFQTQGVALTGNWALGWASLADGATSIASIAFPVAPGQSCILSGAILPAQLVGAEVGVAWFDVNGNPVSTSFANSATVSPGGWNPLAGAFTAPAGAVTGQPVVQVEDSNAGDTTFIDMMFFAFSDVQVLVDWANAPFAANSSAGNAFMDVSPWVRLDGNGVTYTRGRQDAISTIQPGSGSFELQNDLGQFADDSSISIPVAFGGSVTLSRRVQLNFADEKGVWHTRFDGRISEVDYSFDPTGNTSIALIALTDILSYLSQQDALFCWAKQQVLFDSPLYHWTLDDAGTTSLASGSGAGVAVESSGNNGPPLRLVLSDNSSPTAATIGWQDSTGGVETLADAASATGMDGSAYWNAGSNQPSNQLRGLVSGNVGPFTAPIGSVAMVPKQTPQSAQNTFVGGTGYMLTGALPSPIAPTATGSDYTVEMWMSPDPALLTGLALNNGPYIALGLGSGLTKTNLLAGIFLNAGTATVKCSTYSQPPAFLGLNFPGAAAPTAVATTSAAFVPDKTKLPHHLAITIQGDPAAPQVQFYLDGNQIGSGFTLPKGQVYDTICIGGAYGGCGAFYGNLSLASVYPYLLSLGQITTHCQMGQYGMWEATTDDCISQLAQYAGVPDFWSNLPAQHAGLSLTDYFDINGSNALSAMQQYELAEHGLLFGSSQGSLNFHTRSWRMGYGAPDILLPPGVFSEDLQYKIVSQFMVNEEGIAGPNTLGANATTLLANPATGQTSTQTTASSVVQSGYVNTASRDKYGSYATSPVSAPLTLPLIAWSRGYAALGLPSYSYWTDPGLDDRAAWDANSRGEPWAFPAQVSIDLLTLDPTSGLGVSNFYGVDIDNVIAPTPDTLPPSFTDAQTSVEWFIEGVTETITSDSHTLVYFTSPAEPQRAWVPGDAAYGVLGSTTRLGVSTADTAAVEAYGKSVAHDAGGPYWPPNVGLNLNAAPGPPVPPGYIAPQPIGGFIGAADMRGIAGNLQAMLKPPMCVVGEVSQTQSIANGALTGSSPPNMAPLFWDQVFVDTAGGMGAVPGWPNWYLVTVAGYYEIDANIVWGTTATQDGYTGQGWIVVAQSAAQALAAGTGTPLTVNQYVRPIGEGVRMNNAAMNPVCAPTARMYLGVGDMICAGAEQNFTSTRSTGTALGGSAMSIRFTGFAVNDDRTLINTSLGTGGGVSLVSHGPVQQSNFLNTHTYTYQGKSGASPYARLFVGSQCLQGGTPQQGPGSWGSRTSQIAFDVTNLSSVLSGHTILSATVTATNVSSFYQTGARVLLGWTTDTPGKSTFNAQDHNTQSWVMSQWFGQGQTKTFNIPISIVQALKTGGATALVLGNSTNNSDPGNYGTWQGGTAAWTLTVNYR